MKRPSFQFYPGDWQANSNLRRCTHEEKGIWLDIMCLLHDQEEYGVARWPMKELAQAVGAPVAKVKSLVSKGILKGADDGNVCESFVYIPRSGRRNGDPVTIVAEQSGPIWYSSRMVKDEYVRQHAGASTRFVADDKETNRAPKKSQEGTDRAKLRTKVLEKTGGYCYHCNKTIGETWEMDHLMPRSKGGRHTFANLVPSCVECNQDKSDTLPDDWAALRKSLCHSPSQRQGECKSEYKGDGSSSPSSSSSSSKTYSDTNVSGGDAAKSPDEMTKQELWAAGKSLLETAGLPKAQCGSFVGKLVKDYGDAIVVDAVRAAVFAQPADPVEYMKATCQHAFGQRQAPIKKPAAEDFANVDYGDGGKL